jgi:ABC-type transporter Mla subunit MlaD
MGDSLAFNKGVELYDDAIASIKTEGLIGDKFIVIDPGGGAVCWQAVTRSPIPIRRRISWT